MELRQIRSFLSIAETLRFGRTAELIRQEEIKRRLEYVARGGREL